MRKLPLHSATALLAALVPLAFLGCGDRGAEPVAATTPAPVERPNLILLVIDCLRGDALSVAGYERPTTPNLDALAAEGTTFLRAFAQGSWTRPSLPTILTGLYPSEHGLLDLGDDDAAHAQALDEGIETMAEQLAAAGYATAMFGEQHKLAPRFGLGQGFEVWHHRSGGAPNIHRKAVEWAASQGDRPFFEYLHYLELHWPYCPPQETRGRFDEGRPTVDLCADWRGLRNRINAGEHELDEGERHAMRARYDEELLALDAEIGKLFADLKAQGLWDETLIVVTSDHGEEFHEHGGWFHGQSLHDELVHVPLLVKPPASWRAPAGQRLDGLAETRDVSATLLAAAGLAPPPGTVDLRPWVRGERAGEAPRPFAVSESIGQVSLRTANARLIVDREGGGQELFDLEADPGAQRDVAATDPTRAAELRRRLAEWRRALQPPRHGKVVEVDEETRQGLEALGYVN